MHLSPTAAVPAMEANPLSVSVSCVLHQNFHHVYFSSPCKNSWLIYLYTFYTIYTANDSAPTGNVANTPGKTTCE